MDRKGMMADKTKTHAYCYDDLRGWLAAAEELGEVRHISALSWEREIGMASAILQRDGAAPCGLFDDIPRVEKGFRVLTNLFGGRRASVTLGFPAGLTRFQLSDAFLSVYKNPNNKPVPHVVVESGPVFENTYFGAD